MKTKGHNHLNRVLVYGSLRQGGYNQKNLIPKAIFFGTTVIEGFQMFRINKGNERISERYPFVVHTGMKSHKIKVDILLLTNDELRAVQRAEHAYLQKPIMIPDWENDPFLMYIQDEAHMKRYRPEHVECIKSGSWPAYARKAGIF